VTVTAKPTEVTTLEPSKYVFVRGWPIPELQIRGLTGFAVTDDHHLRMAPLECNTPDIEGYSALVCKSNVSKIYAHSRRAAPCPYEDGDLGLDLGMWVYMPIDSDEYLTEIWSVTHHAYLSSTVIVRSHRYPFTACCSTDEASLVPNEQGPRSRLREIPCSANDPVPLHILDDGPSVTNLL